VSACQSQNDDLYVHGLLQERFVIFGSKWPILVCTKTFGIIFKNKTKYG